MIISALNFEKLLFQPELLIKVRDGEAVFPLHMTLSLSNYCNHRCIWCTAYEYQQEKAKHINFEKLVGFLESSRALGLRAITYVGNGEPTLYREFEKLVEQTHSSGLQQGIFTNGTRIEELRDLYVRCFSFVRFSLDGYDDESHASTHLVRHQFGPICRGIRALCEHRSGLSAGTQIGVQYVFHQNNIEGILPVAKLCQDLGVDYLSYKPAFNRGAMDKRAEKNRLTLKDVSSRIGEAKSAYERSGFQIHFREFQVQSIDKNQLAYDQCIAGLFNLMLYEDEKLIICGPKRIAIGTLDDPPVELQRRIADSCKGIGLTDCPGGCRYHSLNQMIYCLRNPAARRSLNEDFI